MFFLYQRFQSPALSPAISMIADRAGSNANSTAQLGPAGRSMSTLHMTPS